MFSLGLLEDEKKTGVTYTVVLVEGSVVGRSNFFDFDHPYLVKAASIPS